MTTSHTYRLSAVALSDLHDELRQEYAILAPEDRPGAVGYSVRWLDAQGHPLPAQGSLLFIPLICVGLIHDGHTLSWTECASPEDLMRRHMAGEMSSPDRW